MSNYNSFFQVVTSGYFGRKSIQVVQHANYGTNRYNTYKKLNILTFQLTNRVWTNNPTFLLSGQLTGVITLSFITETLRNECEKTRFQKNFKISFLS